jgi:hypothetical protein
MHGIIMSDGASILLTVVSTAVGSTASWWISRWYYLRSGTDLAAAVRDLADRRGVNAIASMLEQSGHGKTNRDMTGNVIGVTFERSSSIGLVISGSAAPTVTQGPLPRYDRQHEQPDSEKRDGTDG